MPEQVPFINREDELALIDRLVKEWDTLRILCIDAPGGIGKTRLLQEVRKRYLGGEQTRLRLTEIIDFDDPTYHVAENLGIRIAQMLDEEMFTSFLQDMHDYRKMETIGVSHERLTRGFEEGTQSFIDCFNKLSEQKRAVLLFDTIEKFEGTDYWEYLLQVFSQVKNSLIFIVGRTARSTGESLQAKLAENITHIIDLPPLEEEAGRTYLQKKQELLHIELEPELAQKLILLSKGRPILIDLAVEWRARGISLDWMIKSNLEDIISLSADDIKVRQKEFERQLVIHIAQTRSQMDWLILLMSRVYPLDVKMIAALRNMSEKRAKKLFEEAKTYTFVKLLPDERITLHDEMQRMIISYVWTEIDPDKIRQRHNSELAAKYLESKMQALTKEITQLEKRKKIAEEKKSAKAELDAFMEREVLDREMWNLKAEHLKHTLFVNINEGVKTFVNAFDEATRKKQLNSRESLLIQMQDYRALLSFEQLYELNSRRIEHWRYKGHYSEAKEIATNILDSSDITPEQRVNMLIARGNAEIRLGHVNKGISDFEEAVKTSKTNKLSFIHIKSLNELGWAHRLTGNLEFARENYQEARRLCFEQGGPDKKELQYDYGMISNNLAFVLSNDSRTSRAAVDIAHSAIKHWESIGNDIGLGAGYLVLGITYYRGDLYEEALEAFQKALNIFEPLELYDWLGQIYSWRGVLYYIMRRSEEAKKDLEKSLEIGSSNIKAMTLNRLGRVYMHLGKWDVAEEYIKKSLEHAKQIPDHVYWLGSLARLAAIASEKGEFHRLGEFQQMLNDALKKMKAPDPSSIGIAYFSLAKLAFGQNDRDKEDIIVHFLQESIKLLIEHGPSVSTDVVERLSVIERGFDDVNFVIIRSVGQALQKYISKIEIDNSDYSALTPIMYRWANWKGGEKTDE